MTDKINILVLKECNGRLVASSIPVRGNEFLLNEINRAKKNPNKTLLDIQSLFFKEFTPICSGYPYIFPYEYCESMISGASKPERYDYISYQKELDKKIEYIKRNRCTDFENYAKNSLRESYAEKCCRYIKQQMIYNALQQVANDQSIKMYSHERIGWYSMEYNINEDVKICVSSNFGYGYSSFFTLTASYKGIVIAPVSYIVKYYFANMVDIIQCTRDYNVDRENWSFVLDFVKNFVNKSLDNPNEFVKYYIMNEIEEMMKYLRNLTTNQADYMLRKFVTMNNEEKEYKTLRFISPMSQTEKGIYLAFPKEMLDIFKIEKLTQATRILKQLRVFSEIYAKVNDYIAEIHNMVISIIPKIEITTNDIKQDIYRLNELVKEKEDTKELLNEKSEVFYKELNEIIENHPEKLNWIEKENVKKKYDLENPQYVSVRDNIQVVKSELSQLKCKIESRNALIYRLSAGLNELNAYLSKTV